MSSNPLGLSLQSPIVNFLLAVGAVIFCVPVVIWAIHRVKRVHEKMKEAAREHNLHEAAESGSSASENSSDSEWDVERAIGEKVRSRPLRAGWRPWQAPPPSWLDMPTFSARRAAGAAAAVDERAA
jgi:hypothetical protein